MDPGRYALWLMPSGKLNARLTQLIATLAEEFSAPFFKPHVTLLGGFTGKTAVLVGQSEELAASLRPFAIHLTEAGYLDDYYRSLFIRVALSVSLRNAYLQAQMIFEHSRDPDYQPHLSLLYGHHPAELKDRVIANRVGQYHMKFSVDRLFLIDLAGEPQDWKRIGIFPFQKKRHQV